MIGIAVLMEPETVIKAVVISLIGPMSASQDANVDLEWYQLQTEPTVFSTNMYVESKLFLLNAAKMNISMSAANIAMITTIVATGGVTSVNCETVRITVILDVNVSRVMSEIMTLSVCLRKKPAFQSVE